MTRALTLPGIQQVIKSRLKTVRNRTEDLPATYYKWPGLNELVQAQDTLGWRIFLEVGILHEWAAKQQEYYDWIQKRNTGKQWITTLIKKLWEISWNMWEHRNREAKNPTSPAVIREHARIDAIITREYQDPSTLAQRDRRWFRRPKEVLFTEPLEYKQQWLESVSLARSRYARRHHTSTQTQRNLIRATFIQDRTQIMEQQPPQNNSE